MEYGSKDYKNLIEHVNSCYKDGETLTLKEIEKYNKFGVFFDNLVKVIKDDDGKIVASGIALYDDIAKEGILEWIQVDDKYRG